MGPGLNKVELNISEIFSMFVLFSTTTSVSPKFYPKGHSKLKALGDETSFSLKQVEAFVLKVVPKWPPFPHKLFQCLRGNLWVLMLKRVKNKNKKPRTNKTYTTQREHMFILYSDIQITYLIISFLNQDKNFFLRITARVILKHYKNTCS